MNNSHPGIARAKRKLATAYRLTGKLALANETKRRAEEDAVRLHALDQINR